jgi:uncharacterized protein (TIGR02118 family)
MEATRMVKLIYCLRRQPHLSRDEFQRYWRENHGPLVRRTHRPVNQERYVQVHTAYDDVIGRMGTAANRPEPYDGVAELWYDGVEAFAPAESSAERTDALSQHVADERNFIDLAKSPLWLAEEHVFIDHIPEPPVSDEPAATVKLIYCLRRLSHLSREEFQQYWREKHGPLVQSNGDAHKIRRYVQAHTAHDKVNQALQQSASRPEAFDGVAELWWDSPEDFLPADPSPERLEASRLFAEDEAKFIDWSRSPAWLGRQYVFVDHITGQ